MATTRPPVRGRTLIAAVIACGCAAGIALACDTPVYRYAMYRWAPAPYEVYCFHDQPLGEADQRIAALFKENLENAQQPANVVYIPLSLAEDKELKRIPPDIRQAFLSHENPQLPAYLVATPFGVELSFGKLDETAIRELLDSPARQDLAAQLASGKAGVFLFVPCSDAAANARAESVLKELIQDVQAGKVDLYTAPPAVAPAAGADGPPVAATLELGMVRVDRTDPKEEWLRRALWAMEPNLKNEDQPMLFMTYGRARASLPYIGEGISRENLLGEVYFITGACSCTVKEQNPGMDLLVQRNWEQVAMALAEKFGAEEGNPYGPSVFFPELVVPSGVVGGAGALAADDARGPGAAEQPQYTATGPDPKPTPAEVQPAPPVLADSGEAPETAPVAQIAAADPPAAASDAGSEATSTPAAAEPAGVAAPASAEPAGGAISPAQVTPSASVPAGVSPFQSVWVIGGAVVLGLLFLLLLTFSVLRPH